MKKITNLEIGSLTYFIVRSFFVAICFNSIIHIANQDSYLSIIIGTFIGLVPIICFYILFNYEPSLNIFEKSNKLFGKIIGNIINSILIIFTFGLSLIVFNNLITFVYSQYLNKTPDIFIAIMFIICIFYSLLKGLHNNLRTCIILFFFSAILYSISVIGLITHISIDNFKPFFNSNFINGSFKYVSYAVLPLYLLLLIPKNKISNNCKTNKTIFIFYIISSLCLFIINCVVIGTFGIKLTLLYDYPEFQVLKYVSLIGLSARLDSILFIQWIFDMLIFVIFGLQFCIDGIRNIIKIKRNILIYIFPLLIIILNELIFSVLLINDISINILSNTIFFTINLLLLICLFKLFFKKHKIS